MNREQNRITSRKEAHKYGAVPNQAKRKSFLRKRQITMEQDY